jgi:hypothetical protein
MWCNPIEDDLHSIRVKVIDAIDAIKHEVCEDCELDSKICKGSQFLEQLAELVATTTRDNVQRHWSLPGGRRDITE